MNITGSWYQYSLFNALGKGSTPTRFAPPLARAVQGQSLFNLYGNVGDTKPNYSRFVTQENFLIIVIKIFKCISHFHQEKLNIYIYISMSEKAMAPHSSTLAWKIPWTEEPGGLQSMGSLRIGNNWLTSLSLFTFMLWRRKWQPTPVFLPGESQGQGTLVGCRLWGRTELDTTDAT